ncbi:hypothetical protein FACS189491_10390 [Spirochaetia bacterium]|nr:hypothetical protein FACS189491_10390 [Spirochaetia bacterium]
MPNTAALQNRIEAKDITIKLLLSDKKFFIDYFQREYRWENKHITKLIEDLTTSFMKCYDPSHGRKEVANYQNYYLGPVVFNENEGKMSIIDGQQRITSITLLLIYLKHLQEGNSAKVNIDDLIYSDNYGEKAFNMSDPPRQDCLQFLFEKGEYEPADNDDETVINIVDRYKDIDESFPDDIDGHALPYFIDWLIGKVIVVQIKAYSEENAYIIFETMNDRGLNLTQTEMLKGYVLSKISDKDKRADINEIWKIEIKKLHSDNADISFFQAWFRSKYAEKMREGKAGAFDQDYELIGSRFHNWFKENHSKYLNIKTGDEFYNFFKKEFPFFVKIYLASRKAISQYDDTMPHLNYINYWGIAESLRDPLLLASITSQDDEITYKKKLDFVSRYIETFTVRRAINFKKFGQSAIKYTMFNLIKRLRDNDLPALSANLIDAIAAIDEKWDGIQDLRLHQMNKQFIKHLLSRISSYIDILCQRSTNYVTYHHPEKGKPFEIEHIWADKMDLQTEFTQISEFNVWRNKIGALLLLQNGPNQSFNKDPYDIKVEYYKLQNNAYMQSLHSEFYTKNPNFLSNPVIQKLNFKSHPEFKKADVVERCDLVQRICEKIWETKYFV